jgi:hypothetical protein
MRVYEAIGETLKKLEVQATFGLMGDGNLRFMTFLAETIFSRKVAKDAKVRIVISNEERNLS